MERQRKNKFNLWYRNFQDFSEIPKPDDAADALAICITHINSLSSNISFTGTSNLKKITLSSDTNKISLEEYKKLLKK